jgi:hypothetical protein
MVQPKGVANLMGHDAVIVAALLAHVEGLFPTQVLGNSPNVGPATTFIALELDGI